MGVVARLLWTGCALLLVVLSAFAIIGSTHQSRGSYAQLQELEAQRWYLEEEYSRLLLEQSTWASHNRIESAAGDSLRLVVPGHDRPRLVAR
jgi:cell division protein FtsL